MAEPLPSFQFEDIPIDEARRMRRGPRMGPELYHALKEKIRSPDTAARMLLPDGTRPTTMKPCSLRVTAALHIPVTIRRVPSGLIVWRSTDEDRRQAQESAARRQSAWQPPSPAPRSRRLGTPVPATGGWV
jgi:hypothetical protein